MPNPYRLAFTVTATGTAMQREFDTPLARALFLISMSPYIHDVRQWQEA